jgi:hypothetical protein
MISTDAPLLRPAMESIIEPTRWLCWSFTHVDPEVQGQVEWIRARADAAIDMMGRLSETITRIDAQTRDLSRFITLEQLEANLAITKEPDRNYRSRFTLRTV